MKAFAHAAAALVAVFFAQSASAACYVVYGPDRDIIYRAPEPPIDMSRHIHETLPLVAPGATLVFTPDQQNCELAINKLPLTGAVLMRGSSGGRGARADRG